MNPVQTFLQKINQVITLIGSESEAEEIKTNLLSSLYLDLTTKIGLDPRNKEFLDEIAAKSPKTVEEMDKAVAFAQEKLKTTGFDVNLAVSESSRSVLESFVSKVSPQLPPEKVEELKKLTSE